MMKDDGCWIESEKATLRVLSETLEEYKKKY